MNNWQDELAILKAQLAVQQMALRALAHSHPRPGAVLEEWRKLRADSVAAAYGLPNDVRSEWLSDYVHTFAEDWTAELADAATRHATHRGASTSDPDLMAPA
jgi:hypothetical protein